VPVSIKLLLNYKHKEKLCEFLQLKNPKLA